ncbi:MAG: hypothetical protein Q8861_10205 [Bacteroidota bacterium]|nr:hypothetical protein [Bacteroidota bacterium]
MITKEELETKYAGLSNEELMEIAEHQFDYTELAVIVAFEELSRRKITEEDIQKRKTTLLAETDVFIRHNIDDDLSIIQKNLFYYLWFPGFNFIFRLNFQDEGYILKLKQASYYSKFGFLFMIIAIVLSFILNFGSFVILLIWILGFGVAYALDEKYNRQGQIKQLRRIMDRATRDETPQANR